MSDLPPLLLAATREYARIRPTAQHEYTTLSVEHAAAGKDYVTVAYVAVSAPRGHIIQLSVMTPSEHRPRATPSRSDGA
eukprot:scaffold136428_cov307-Phaeocystis_antarctica.AAC.1